MISFIEVERGFIISKYLGRPYGQNFKCFDLIKSIYADLGIKVQDFDACYIGNSESNGDYLKKPLDQYFEKVDSPKLFDLVLFNSDSVSGLINHAGVMLDWYSFIHTCRAGTIISRTSQGAWLQKIEGYYRFKHDTDHLCT